MQAWAAERPEEFDLLIWGKAWHDGNNPLRRPWFQSLKFEKQSANRLRCQKPPLFFAAPDPLKASGTDQT
jgi:hypothetical protein